jgi:hypothetical protein
MKALRITLCIASLATPLAACSAAPEEEAVGEAEETGEDRSALVFSPGDPDLIWSGPAAYSAPWAQQAFTPYPALYIAKRPSGGMVGVVHLAPTTICHFSTFTETAQRLYIQGGSCSGQAANLAVYLDCEKQPSALVCAGNVGVPGGLQSGVSWTGHHEEACAPGNCLIGPFDPVPQPKPSPDNNPGGCPQGCSPCGSGCCLPGERCGDSHCYIREPEDEVVAR